MASTNLPDSIYVGSAVRPGINSEGRRGVKSTPMAYFEFGAIAAAAGEGIIKDATGTQIPDAAETVTYTASTDGTDPQDATTRPTKVTISVSGVEYEVLDLGDTNLGKNIVTVVTHATSIVAMTIKHYGFDINKAPMTESGSITATGTSKTFAGKKAFRYWWKTDLTAAADASANTVDVGTGAVIGLPVRITSPNAVMARKDGVTDASATVVTAVTTTASSTTGDVRGTVDFATDPDGSAVYGVFIALADTSSKTAIDGVTQA